MKKPCSKCGGTDFNTSGHCKPCRHMYYLENKAVITERAAAWKQNNPEKMASIRAKEADSNRAENVARLKAWKLENPEKTRKYNQTYRKDNLLAYRAYEHNRRRRKLDSGGEISSDIAQRLFVLQKGKCACCKQPLGDDFHMDHIMPLALGGPNTDENIQLLRSKCNRQKNAKHPIDFMQSRGLLL